MAEQKGSKHVNTTPSVEMLAELDQQIKAQNAARQQQIDTRPHSIISRTPQERADFDREHGIISRVDLEDETGHVASAAPLQITRESNVLSLVGGWNQRRH